MEKLAQIEERARKATGGPWVHERERSVWGGAAGLIEVIPWCPEHPTWNGEFDREFIAAARTDVPALCKSLRRALAGLEHALTGCNTPARCLESARAAALAELSGEEEA